MCVCVCVCVLSQIRIHDIEYIQKLIYIFLLLSLLYNSSIRDTDHSPNYMAFGQPQTLQVR